MWRVYWICNATAHARRYYLYIGQNFTLKSSTSLHLLFHFGHFPSNRHTRADPSLSKRWKIKFFSSIHVTSLPYIASITPCCRMKTQNTVALHMNHTLSKLFEFLFIQFHTLQHLEQIFMYYVRRNAKYISSRIFPNFKSLQVPNHFKTYTILFTNPHSTWSFSQTISKN